MNAPFDRAAIDAALREGLHVLSIAGLDLAFHAHTVRDPVLTAAQIARLAGHVPDADVIVLQWMPDGSLEEVGGAREVDLREPGTERFVVAIADRTFRVEVAGQVVGWPARAVTGATLKRLAGKGDEDLVAVVEHQDRADEEIEDDGLLDLGGQGVERVYFRRRERTVGIAVNNKAVRIQRGLRTGAEVKAAAIAASVAIQADFVLSVQRGPGDTDIVGDSDRLRMVEGMRFVAVAPDDNS